MSRAQDYAWIVKTPRKKVAATRPPSGKGRRAGLPFMDEDCPNCGFGPFGWRRICAACCRPRPVAA